MYYGGAPWVYIILQLGCRPARRACITGCPWVYIILLLCCRPARRACVTGCPLGILYSAVCDTLPAAHPPAPCSSHLLSLQYSGH
jgi:hypothetical protein